MKVQIFTDGSCIGNGKKAATGGWACILVCGSHYKEISGYEPEATNNSMEITAAIKGLEALKATDASVEIYSDSQYLVSTMNCGWSRNYHILLWEELDRLVSKFKKVEFIKVKAHSGHKENERADLLARTAAERGAKNEGI